MTFAGDVTSIHSSKSLPLRDLKFIELESLLLFSYPLTYITQLRVTKEITRTLFTTHLVAMCESLSDSHVDANVIIVLIVTRYINCCLLV